jgi:purine-nucleoside/S-methyl-5'-thioadenosine phosphorylase / adenosine deaminase
MVQPYITLPSFAMEEHGVEHFFGTRHTPVEVTPGVVGSPNRTVFSSRSPTAVISVRQVHGTDVLIIDRPVQAGQSFDGGWDALITDQPGLAVTVRTADCVPVLIHDPVHQAVAAVHAGWRGAVAGIVPKTIAALAQRFGSRSASLRMAIGPSAGRCCYEVDEPVLKKLRDVFPDWQLVVKGQQGLKGLLDLREFVRRQALMTGLTEAAIAVADVCTICHPSLFFSYRREGVVKNTMASGIALIPPR